MLITIASDSFVTCHSCNLWHVVCPEGNTVLVRVTMHGFENLHAPHSRNDPLLNTETVQLQTTVRIRIRIRTAVELSELQASKEFTCPSVTVAAAARGIQITTVRLHSGSKQLEIPDGSYQPRHKLRVKYSTAVHLTLSYRNREKCSLEIYCLFPVSGLSEVVSNLKITT